MNGGKQIITPAQVRKQIAEECGAVVEALAD